MKKFIVFSKTMLIFLFFIGELNAQWVKTSGLFDGQISALSKTGDTIYACSDGDGVFVSFNNGKSWTESNNGLTTKYIHTIVAIGSDLFVGAFGGIFHSSDSGNLWRSSNDGLTDNSINTLITDGTFLFAGTNKGVFRSSDRGSSWMAIDSGMAVNMGSIITSVNTKNSLSDSVLLKNSHVMKDAYYMVPIVKSLIFDGLTLYACSDYGIYYSNNHGDYWMPLRLTRWIPPPLCFTIQDSNIIVGTEYGAYLLSKQDTLWNVISLGLTDKYIVTLAFLDSTIIAGTSDGMYVSPKQNVVWHAVNCGLLRSYIKILKIIDDTIYVGSSHGGVFRSTDGGNNWTVLNVSLKSTYIYSLTANQRYLFAGTYDGLFRSSNNGLDWDDISSGLPSRSGIILGIHGKYIFAASGFHGLYRSSDNGSSWQLINKGIDNSYSDIGPLIVEDSTIITDNGNDLFRSSDDGDTWVKINSVSPCPYLGTLAIGSDGTGGTYYYAGTIDSGAYRSHDKGITWASVNVGLTSPEISIFAVNGKNLFAGSGYGYGAFLSTDCGTRWTSINTGLTSKHIFAFAFSDIYTFVGTVLGGGVFLSSNNGSTWIDVNTGFSDPGIQNLLVSGPYLFAATANGVWRRPLLEMTTSVSVGKEQIPSQFLLKQNYPNPFNPSTAISFSLPTKSYVLLRIFDLIGREIATIASEELSAGTYTRQWNAANISSGIYFYRLQAGSFIETKKLILLR